MILKLNKYIILLLFNCAFLLGYSQEKSGTQNVLILEAYAHLGNGEVLKNSAIGIKGETITLVEDYSRKNIDTSFYDVIIHAKNKHLYPGFIAMNSTLGLLEIGAVRATRDYQEAGRFNPNSRTLTVFNTDSRITPTVRSNGVLMGQISPRGGTISGQSSVMHFNGWNWEDAVIKADEGIHLNWPNINLKKVNSYNNSTQQINEFFEKSLAYSKAKETTIDLRLKSMADIFTGEKRLYIHAEEVNQLKDIVIFKNKFKIPKLTIVGGAESHYIPEILLANNISVLVKRVHSLPLYSQDKLTSAYELPALLYKNGVKFCFQNQGDMEQMQTRNLPFLAGTAVAYGLPYEEAIKALTSNSADLLGLKNYGTIKVGYSATLFISEGDALDVISNKITHAYIKGTKINLSNHQTENYLKYTSKYGLEPKP